MDIEKYKKSFAYEIQESKKNEMLKIFYDNAISKLPETSRGIGEVLVGVAYIEGKKDGYSPSKTNIRV